MATVLLIGSDAALLEGVAQVLAAAGHAARVALDVADGAESALADPPLVAVVERSLALADARALGIRLASGGALLLYHAAAGGRAAALTPALQRATLADLALPLERQRLLALIHKVEERARVTGRVRHGEWFPEQRAP